MKFGYWKTQIQELDSYKITVPYSFGQYEWNAMQCPLILKILLLNFKIL